ncbi:unnamed protein product, partial [Nesidiocoris tenuis]
MDQVSAVRNSAERVQERGREDLGDVACNKPKFRPRKIRAFPKILNKNVLREPMERGLRTVFPCILVRKCLSQANLFRTDLKVTR